MTTKPCTACGEDKPRDSDHFHPMPGGDGFRSQCRDCRNAKRRKRYDADPMPAIAASAAWRAANPGRAAAAERRRRAADPVKAQAQYTRENHRRRARKVGATVGPVDVAAARTSAVDCYLCGDLLGGDIHLDHVIPLARGGAHCQNNLRPTHDACNLRKGDKLLSELDWYVGPTGLGVGLP